MDPVTVIVAALAAGGASGVGETASVAVRDAYETLKSLVGRRLGQGETETGPAEPEAVLVGMLREAGAADDAELLAAARRVLASVRAEAAPALGHDLRGAQGVMINHGGAGARQVNTFPAPPTA
ncbi:MAG TPA: hypothetical protein VHJ17_11265 [Thermomonospora sp.]|nr:hypothetical protein [Thermomonospora sp.]